MDLKEINLSEWTEIQPDGSNIMLGYQPIYKVKNIKNGYNFTKRSIVNGNFLWKMYMANEASHFRIEKTSRE